jgi:hypothetical protein
MRHSSRKHILGTGWKGCQCVIVPESKILIKVPNYVPEVTMRTRIESINRIWVIIVSNPDHTQNAFTGCVLIDSDVDSSFEHRKVS